MREYRQGLLVSRSAWDEEGKDVASRQISAKAAKPEPLSTPMENSGIIDFEIIELFFFAYRDFVSDPDAILEKSGFGRAHHRVVHFVNREPGMTVADLLDTLKITKQSLARVLKQLIDSGYIRQVAGPEDRRQRKLYPTKTGRELALALAEPQSRRIERAFDNASLETRESVKAFLRGMRDRQTARAD
jgi:DNA-binding MarR family transcriptional regulator